MTDKLIRISADELARAVSFPIATGGFAYVTSQVAKLVSERRK